MEVPWHDERSTHFCTFIPLGDEVNRFWIIEDIFKLQNYSFSSSFTSRIPKGVSLNQNFAFFVFFSMTFFKIYCHQMFFNMSDANHIFKTQQFSPNLSPDNNVLLSFNSLTGSGSWRLCWKSYVVIAPSV